MNDRKNSEKLGSDRLFRRQAIQAISESHLGEPLWDPLEDGAKQLARWLCQLCFLRIFKQKHKQKQTT